MRSPSTSFSASGGGGVRSADLGVLGQRAINRAIDGDEVVARLLPRAKWGRARVRQRAFDQAAVADDDAGAAGAAGGAGDGASRIGGDASGGFGAGVGLPGGSASTYAVAMGDVTGDGHLDLLIGNRAEANELLVNDGNGGFSAAIGFPGGSATTKAVAMADVDLSVILI